MKNKQQAIKQLYQDAWHYHQLRKSCTKQQTQKQTGKLNRL